MYGSRATVVEPFAQQAESPTKENTDVCFQLLRPSRGAPTVRNAAVA